MRIRVSSVAKNQQERTSASHTALQKLRRSLFFKMSGATWGRGVAETKSGRPRCFEAARAITILGSRCDGLRPLGSFAFFPVRRAIGPKPRIAVASTGRPIMNISRLQSGDDGGMNGLKIAVGDQRFVDAGRIKVSFTARDDAPGGL